MTAKEMFEKLGFKTIEKTSPVYAYIGKNGKSVYFWKDDKKVHLSSSCGAIGIELHQAIHQQMKELGWIK